MLRYHEISNIHEHHPYFHQVDVPVLDTEDPSQVILAIAKVAVPETVRVPVPEPPKVGWEDPVETGIRSRDDMGAEYCRSISRLRELVSCDFLPFACA